MAQNPLVPKKRKASEAKSASGSIPSNLPKSTRRKFLKMAGVVSAVVLLEKQARAMAVPKFDSKWLAAVKMSDVNTVDYSCAGCNGTTNTGIGMAALAEQQKQTNWCAMGVAMGIVNYYITLYASDNDFFWLNMQQCGLYEVLHNMIILPDATPPNPDCCAAQFRTLGKSDTCNQSSDMNIALITIGHMLASEEGKPCFNELTGYLDGLQPAIIEFLWFTGTSHNWHVQIICGYACDQNGTAWIDISDPWEGNFLAVGYNTWEAHFSATWKNTYYTQGTSD